ncbi:MAG: substrate-binding domain-containing protein [Lachnospiraceae bacterium]|jgi:phosphate transport system substrate-binding protein|nr:substrate-binding domain-containing protein [Lachnospiraceae bacterium]
MNKLIKQIIAILLVIAVFVLLNLSIYKTVTRRFIDTSNKKVKNNTIQLKDYLPFDDKSSVVKVNSKTKITDDIPVLDGATALYPVFSAFANAKYPKDSVSFKDGKFSEKSKLQMNNTRGAYKRVVDGTSDIIFCAQPSKEQLEYAKEKGATLKQVPIGREAFVFIVNSHNSIDNLSVDQIKGIYTGKYTNWKEVGGGDNAIAAVQRNAGSGSQTAMLSFMGKDKMKRDINVFKGSAIGYSFRYYVTDMIGNKDIKMISLNGVYPNEDNIKNGKYQVSSNFYAIYREDNKNPNIEKMINWILSDEGQDIIEKTGYVGA